MLNNFMYNNDRNKRRLSINNKDTNNIMNQAKIKTFKNIGRRKSKYNLLEEAKAFQNFQNQENLNNSKKLELDSNFSSMISSENSSSIKPENIIKSVNIKKGINLHRYTENALPVNTNSKQINKEIDLMMKRNNYYMKNIGDNNFGYKYVRHNPAYDSYDKNNEEEFIQLMGLNDEEKDPFSVVNNKTTKINEKLEIKTDNAKYLLFQTAKKKAINRKVSLEKKNGKQKMFKVNYDYFLKNNNHKKISKKKKEIVFSLMKKDEFSDFLITNYLKVYYPKLLKNIDNDKTIDDFPLINNNNKTKRMKKKKRYEKRKIYVIKDSTIISNPSQIPGFIAQIPSVKEMKTYSLQKKLLIMQQFLDYAADKFRSHLTFKYIFSKDRNNIIDFTDLPEKHKYIFVSPNSIFQGLSIPLNKNIFQLYLKHFSEEEDDNFYFNESSIEESVDMDKNIINNDDIYDIFLIESQKKNQEKIFKKKLIKKDNNKKVNSSFTFGIEEKEYEYIYYSDDEKRKMNFINNHYRFYKNKLDFYIDSQNELFDNKIKLLLGKLRTNNDGKIRNIQKYKQFQKTKNELIECYLTERKIPKKNLLKKQFESRPLKGQDIVDAFNLLKNKDSSININKFIITEKGKKADLPFVEKNILDNSSKYCLNRRKTDLEYPSILSYNLPKVVESNPKYSLTDLIKYYTKFKSLVNLWFNMHTNANVVQYGIDFETFHRCTEDLCDEDEYLVKKIFDRINTGTSGVLSLEDYVDALNIMNSKDILDQIEFFMKVFNSKEKEYFSFDDIFEICKISIKRLIKNKKSAETEKVVKDLGHYLADYIVQICESDKIKGIKVSKLKDILMNDKKNIEYLKLFMCSFGDDKNTTVKKSEKKLNNLNNDGINKYMFDEK